MIPEPGMKEEFEAIYAENRWGCGSGEGSLPINTGAYVETIQAFINEHGTKKVVDVGCGDWQFSRLIDWSGVEYHGFDIADSVITQNRAAFGADNINFHYFGGAFAELPDADLLLAKDVLQHWSNATVERFLPSVDRFRHSIITNCVNPKGPTENKDISDGGFRRLDITLPPFNVAASELLRFTNKKPRLLSFLQRTRWEKRVLLLTS
jgi:SAM-dependent methyltransferase